VKGILTKFYFSNLGVRVAMGSIGKGPPQYNFIKSANSAYKLIESHQPCDHIIEVHWYMLDIDNVKVSY
jgi:hypothetical protein